MRHVITEDDQTSSPSDGCESWQQSDDDAKESSRDGWNEDWSRKSDESAFDRTNEEFHSEDDRAGDIESDRGDDNEYSDPRSNNSTYDICPSSGVSNGGDSQLSANKNARLPKSPVSGHLDKRICG